MGSGLGLDASFYCEQLRQGCRRADGFGKTLKLRGPIAEGFGGFCAMVAAIIPKLTAGGLISAGLRRLFAEVLWLLPCPITITAWSGKR